MILLCSQGLDEISYGGRRSRCGSISRDTSTNTYSYASRRGSVSTSVDYAALIAATNTVECAATSNHLHTSNNVNNKNEKHILAVVDQNNPESGLGNSPKSKSRIAAGEQPAFAIYSK